VPDQGGGLTVAAPRRRKWRGFVVQLIFLAIWVLAYRFLIAPLVPGDALGIVLLVLLSLGILAVPAVTVLNRRKR
jgi:hypothetical protein